MIIEPKELHQLAEEISSALLKKTHQLEMHEKLSITYGHPVSFAMQTSEDQHKVLWKSRISNTPAINDLIISPLDGKAYRVTGIRHDALPNELESDCFVGHAIVLMFPK